MRDHPKQPPVLPSESTKTFEDAAFEMLTKVSPVKLPREDIPFDSVRQIVLDEIVRQRQRPTATNRPSMNGRGNMEEFDEAPSSSNSSSHPGESSSSILERGTMTDDGIETMGTPRPIAARLYGENTRSSTTSTSSATPSGSHDDTITTATNQKKKPLNYREKRLAEIRGARMKKYRENVEIVEFKCEESGLKEAFLKFYEELLADDSAPANVYYRIVESLDFFFRAKTWESNCPKLLCEFLCENILKTCQELNELHDKSNASDEWKAREIQIQVLLTLHVFVVTDEKKWLDESINKMRMIFISVGAEKLRTFVEEPVTDCFLELIGDGLATIYDELCINLPADLLQYNSNLFKMTESDDTFVIKRRNGAANRLEQMLLETSDNLGIGGVERSTRSSGATTRAKEEEAPTAGGRRRSLKRKNEEIPKELLSPTRPTRGAGRSDYKQFFVEDTPDEKYYKAKTTKKTLIVEDVEEEEEEEEVVEEADGEEVKVVYHRKKTQKKITIKEEIDEEVKQTPVAKLRAAATRNGKRCSKRLSDLVKLSEERSQIPKKARENLNRILEKAKTPIRTNTRRTRKSVLFGPTPTSSPAIMGGSSSKKSARSSLLGRFSGGREQQTEDDDDDEKKTSPSDELQVDTSDGHDIPTTSSTETSTPTLREKSKRRRPARYRGNSFTETRTASIKVKPEPEDTEFDEIEQSSAATRSAPSTSSSAATTPKASSSKWTDRKLKRQLGLTREDLNRYRDAMLTTGERNQNKNEKINWESAQVNRAGRVKGAGASEDGTKLFGICRKSQKTMICHTLLNDSNPDTSFNWNKVKFDDLADQPSTSSSMPSLRQKPEEFMESLKQEYIKSKTSPLKRRAARLSASSAAQASSSEPCTSSSSASTSGPPPAKKQRRSSAKMMTSPRKKPSPRKSLKAEIKSEVVEPESEEYDNNGFESEADE